MMCMLGIKCITSLLLNWESTSAMMLSLLEICNIWVSVLLFMRVSIPIISSLLYGTEAFSECQMSTVFWLSVYMTSQSMELQANHTLPPSRSTMPSVMKCCSFLSMLNIPMVYSYLKLLSGILHLTYERRLCAILMHTLVEWLFGSLSLI
jgi:hypothetical protein